MPLYKVVLQTGGKTSEQIKADFEESEISEQEIRNWISAYNLIDGLEVMVLYTNYLEDYTLLSWKPEDDKKFMEFIYLLEQDSMFGNYVDDRETFLKDWENGEYSPDGSICFSKNDVEILKKINYGEEPSEKGV